MAERFLFDECGLGPEETASVESESKASPTQRPYRVLHSADWHLGKTLSDESRYEEHQHFLNWLLETIKVEQIDAIIVAGDIFDSARPPQRAVKQYYEFLANLYRETCGECRIVLTAGNHDSPAHLDAPRQILETLHAKVVGELPEDMTDAICPLPDADHPEVIVAALPFLRDRDLRSGRLGQSSTEIEKALRQGIRERYEQAAAACEGGNDAWAKAAKIAVGHLTVKGAKDSDSEREIHIGGLGSVGHDVFPSEFDYVALGHLHRPQKTDASARVCYSGSPIPLSFSESKDKKSVRILDFVNGELVSNETLPIPVCRHLVQLRTTRDKLELTLAADDLPSAELPTWVELIVETSDVSEDVATVARELVEEKPFHLVCIRRERIGAEPTLESAGVNPESIDDLLADPKSVFGRLLEQHVDLTDDDCQALVTAFSELCDEHDRRESADEESVEEDAESVAASAADDKAIRVDTAAVLSGSTSAAQSTSKSAIKATATEGSETAGGEG